MITIAKTEKYEDDKILVELRGLSTDEKPITMGTKRIQNGSLYIEIDTGKIYMYDFAGEEWKEI